MVSFLPITKYVKGETSLFFSDTKEEEIKDPEVEISGVKDHDSNGDPIPLPTPNVKFDVDKSIEEVNNFPWFIWLIPLISGILFIINKIRHHIINRRKKK